MTDTTKRDAVLEEYRPAAGERVSLLGVAYLENPVKVFDMADEIVRLRDILALLRKPNEGVVRAANKSFYGVDKPNSLTWAIIAAVAAAEQEVDHG